MSVVKRGLGRGLASLIPDSALDVPASDRNDRPNLRLVPLDEIRANPLQPREVFDAEDLKGLAASIREHGVLSPLVVRRAEGRYVLIAGERRLRAAGMAGLTEVPVVVREADEASKQLELALVENLQRTDLDSLEAARGYQKLIDDYGYTQDEVAQRVGKERPTVANALRLLKLPDFVLDAVRNQAITPGHGRALLPIVDADELRRVLAKVLSQELSVRATEKLVATLLRKEAPAPAPKREKSAFEYVTKVLGEALHTSVSVRTRKDGSGAIMIDYADAADLDRLVRAMQERG